MRALGLDVGSKKIGIAMTDEAEIAAHPHSVLLRAGARADCDAIATLVASHAITDIAVGIPYELTGKVGHRAKRVQVLVDALRAALPAVEFHEVDERFTTSEAERVLLQADLSRDKRKAVIDQQAAAIILRTWLDSRTRLQQQHHH